MASLSELRVGEHATIDTIDCCSKNYQSALMEMGLLPNTPITLIRKAPLGDPIEIAVRGYRLTLRLSEAKDMTLTPIKSVTA